MEDNLDDGLSIKDSVGKLAEDAKCNGFVDPLQLSQILADDNQYTDHLPRIWKKFQFDIRLGAEPDISTWNSRAGVWFNLLTRMTTGRVAAVRSNWDIKKRLSLYCYNDEAGELEEKNDQVNGQYAKLEDLKRYFAEIVKIPRPRLLFSKEKKTTPDNQSKETQNDQQYSFFLNGDYWKVKFNGETKTLKDLPRLRYIIRLLENQNKKFSHYELQLLVSGKQPDVNENYSKMNDEQLQKEGFSVNLQIDEISPEELDKLGNTVHDALDDEKQYQAMIKHLRNEYGIMVMSTKNGPVFKKFKRLDKDSEKVRSTVTKNIGNAINDMKEKFPPLHDHLKQYIKTDGTCRYEIDEKLNIRWNN